MTRVSVCLNSLVGHFNVKTHDIGEGNVITGRDLN